jgi:hypothetical protein
MERDCLIWQYDNAHPSPRVGSDQREIHVPEMASAQSKSVTCENDVVDN